MDESDLIIKRYERRKNLPSDFYSIMNPEVYLTFQEKERALIKWIKKAGILPLENKTLLEIGCGDGNNLLQFIKLGFQPENLFANDLIEERLNAARNRLPAGVKFLEGDALKLDLPNDHLDIVFQSMVFSSILNPQSKLQLAEKMWNWVKPGGGILWYDFMFDNPFNKDVKGIKFKEVLSLFNPKSVTKWRLTLAPPLSRVITKIHPSLYTIINRLKFLRTHLLIWMRK